MTPTHRISYCRSNNLIVGQDIAHANFARNLLKVKNGSPLPLAGKQNLQNFVPIFCAPGLTRTANLLLRRETFCPIKLRGQN